MGNMIIKSGFVEPTVETPSEIDSNYPWSNTSVYARLMWQARSITANEWTIVCDFGAATVIGAVMLNDVNFTSVTIQGNDTDSWGGSPSLSQAFTVSEDAEATRYKIFCLLTSFNYRYLRIKVPAQSRTDGLAAFRISSRIFLASATALSQNPGSYSYYGVYPDPIVNEFFSGGKEIVDQGNNKIIHVGMGYTGLEAQYVSEISAINKFKPTDNLVFFENLGDTTKCVLCRKDTDIQMSWPNYWVRQTNEISFTEVI